ncbi:MAG: (Fe-S)-binding protein [bacterium]|nr:(Fe-S)-binding protein [bacterium]
MNRSPKFAAPTYEQLLNCMRCGFCLPVCPVYRELGIETASPRGWLALSRAVADSKLPISRKFDRLMYHCLSCQACVAACPSGVLVDSTILDTRAILNQERKQPWFKAPLFHWLTVTSPRLEWAMVPYRVYDRIGLRSVIQKLGILRLISQQLDDLDHILPKLESRAIRRTLPKVMQAVGERKFRVGYFLNCANNLIFTGNVRASLTVLTENHCEVENILDAKCCGMPHRAYGELGIAKQIARHNLNIFKNLDVDAIITDCATCGSMLKEYETLFRGEPEAELAKQLDKKLVDISEFLSRIGIKEPPAVTPAVIQSANIHWLTTGATPSGKLRVTYHDPCHLGRAQKVTKSPRILLQSIPNVEFVELVESDWCCGGAGSYNLTKYDISMKILDRKMKNIGNTAANLVASGCPSCLMQLGLGVYRSKLNVQVIHPVQLLALAYQKQR